MNYTIETQENCLDNIESLESRRLEKIARLLWTVCSPFILLFGTFGNSMILIVLRRTSLGGAGQSMSIFFGALAVSDLLLLYTGLVRQWLLNTLSVEVRLAHTVVCKLHVFVVYLLSMTSSWFLVCMTMLRVISVVWPHRAGLQCTQRKAKVTVAVVVLFLMALNVPLLISKELQVNPDNGAISCYDQDRFDALIYYVAFVYPWFDLLFSSALPSLILFVGNAVLGINVARASRRAHRLMAGQGRGQQSRAREKAASSLTVTVMIVSAMFLFLTLPLCVYLIIDHYTEMHMDELGSAKLNLAFTLTSLPWYINSTVNFYVYCLTGTKFRAECWRLYYYFLCCHRKKGGVPTGSLDAAAGGIFSVEHRRVDQLGRKRVDDSAATFVC